MNGNNKNNIEAGVKPNGLNLATLEVPTDSNSNSNVVVVTSKSIDRLATFKPEKQEVMGQRKQKSVGHFRHVIAILALSGIVLANMNRQAYNQALVRMSRNTSAVFSSKAAANIINNDSLNLTTTATTILDSDVELLESLNQSTYTTINNNYSNNSSSINENEIAAPTTNQDDLDNQDRYDWTASQISLLQAAFPYGYTPFMIPGGRLSEIYGAKWVIFLSGFGSALCSLLVPILADYSFPLLVASRIAMGICQTGISPALFGLLTRWLPPEESSVYLAMIKVGVMFGFMFGSLINGFLPWRLMFYLVSLIGFLWSLMWTICVSSRPEEHKFLSKSELEFIQSRLRQHKKDGTQEKLEADKDDDEDKKQDRNRSAPWWNIITNPIVIAFTFTKFTVKLSTDTQSMQLPMYLKKVFHVSDQLNGILNGINFALQAIFTGLVAFTAKEMILRRTFGLSKTGVRKLFQIINNIGMASAYLIISFNINHSLPVVCCAVILLSISSMFGSGGEAVLPVDLTAEYSASIMAIANSVANLSGILLPKVVEIILDGNLESSTHWTIVW